MYKIELLSKNIKGVKSSTPELGNASTQFVHGPLIWLPCTYALQYSFNSSITWSFSTGPLPHLVHRLVREHRIVCNSVFLFIFIIPCLTPGFIYHTPYKPCTEYKINNLFMGFSLLLSPKYARTSKLLMNLSSQHPAEVV